MQRVLGAAQQRVGVGEGAGVGGVPLEGLAAGMRTAEGLLKDRVRRLLGRGELS